MPNISRFRAVLVGRVIFVVFILQDEDAVLRDTEETKTVAVPCLKSSIEKQLHH